MNHAYERIRECKAHDIWPEAKEEWMAYFDTKALSHFWWPTAEELKDWEKRWFATPLHKRFNDPSLKMPWDFMSLFEAFKNGDYELHPIRMLSLKEAVLPFHPYGHPYGSTNCMCALIEAFDHQVTELPEEE